MKNRFIFRKYAALLMMSVSTVVFLQEALFAQGAVIGYVNGRTDDILVSDDQLDRLTHAMAVDLYPDANGNLNTSDLLNAKGTK